MELNTIISILFCTYCAISNQEVLQKLKEFEENNKSIWAQLSNWWSGTPPSLCEIQAENFEKLRKGYATAFRKLRAELANGMLKNCVYSSAIEVILQFIRFTTIWNIIKDAENYICDKKEEIADNITAVETKIQTLKEEQFKFLEQKGTRSYRQQKKSLDDMKNTVLEIHTLIETARRKLAESKVELNGKLERLIANQEGLQTSTASSILHMVVNVFQFRSGAGHGSEILVRSAAGAIAVHAASTALGAYTLIVNAGTLNKCREVYEEIKRADKQLEILLDKQQKIKVWVDNAIDSVDFEEQEHDRFHTGVKGVFAVLLIAILLYFEFVRRN